MCTDKEIQDSLSVCDSSVGEMSIVSRLLPWPAFIGPLHKQVMFHLHEGEGEGENKAGRIPTNV